MEQQQQSRWRPTRRQLVSVGGITTVAFLLLVICGYYFGWKWTGLHERTLWDWLDLLIVPAALAIGVFWLNRRQAERDQQAEEENNRRESEAQAVQSKREIEVQNQRAQDQAVQSYIDQMSQMIADKDQPLHHSQPGDVLSLLAQVRTQTVLRRLDPPRKRGIVEFLAKLELVESSQIDVLLNAPLTRRLIQEESEQDRQHRSPVGRKLRNPATDTKVFHHLRKLFAFTSVNNEGEKDDTAEKEPLSLDRFAKTAFNPSHQIVVSLQEADLKCVDLRGLQLPNVNMYRADLCKANLDNVALPNANLVSANLSGASLQGTELSGANLNYAILNNADLSDAHLRDAKLINAQLQNANLHDASLAGANMEKADLQDADLTGVGLFPDNLTEANMTGAKGITESEYFKVRATYGSIALKDAIMPNGQKYEDWLKDKASVSSRADKDAALRELDGELDEYVEELPDLREDGKNE